MPKYLNYSKHRFPSLSEAEREDVFMDAVLKLLKKMKEGAYTEQGKMKSLLFKIANGLAINRINELKNKGEVTHKVGTALYGHEQELSKEEIEHLAYYFDKVLKQLKPADQEIVIYRFTYGYTFEAIANHMNLSSTDAAKSRWNYVKKKIKTILDKNKDTFLD